MSTPHPYKDYEQLRAWKVLNQGLADLVANGDIEQKTASVYIVGYLSKLLADAEIFYRPKRLVGAKSQPKKPMASNGSLVPIKGNWISSAKKFKYGSPFASIPKIKGYLSRSAAKKSTSRKS